MAYKKIIHWFKRRDWEAFGQGRGKEIENGRECQIFDEGNEHPERSVLFDVRIDDMERLFAQGMNVLFGLHNKDWASFFLLKSISCRTCSDYLKIIVCINLYFFHNIDWEEKERTRKGRKERSERERLEKDTAGTTINVDNGFGKKESSSLPIVKGRRESWSVVQFSLVPFMTQVYEPRTP